MARIRSFLDRHAERFVSRKLLAWLTATGLIIAQRIDGDSWIAVTLGYIGAQAATDAIVAWKHGSSK